MRMRMRKYGGGGGGLGGGGGGGLGGVFKRGKWKGKGKGKRKGGDVNNPLVSSFERSSGGDVQVLGAVQEQREGDDGLGLIFE